MAEESFGLRDGVVHAQPSVAVSTASATLGSHGLHLVDSLAEAAGAFTPAEVSTMREIFTTLLGSSASRPLASPPAYTSDVVDDHTPYELSVALGVSPELRMLVEPVDRDLSLRGRWRTARTAGEWLRDRHGIEMSRLDEVADLFEPRTEYGLLALWYAIVFRPGQAPDAKAYVDLRARGTYNTARVLEEALARLGLSGAYASIRTEAGARGILDELVYFSLDLNAREEARVKVYLRHHDASAADAERVLGSIGGLQPGDVREFCRTILGHEGPYRARPLVSCWSFSSEGAKPTGATLYAPVAYYVRDDQEASQRIGTWLEPQPHASAAYASYLAGYARRNLAAGSGMHSYVSFKRDRGTPKTTVYLAPEAYKVFTPGMLAQRRVQPPGRPRQSESLVRHFELVERIAEHPLFERLAREQPVVGPLWTILANNWVGIGESFPTWLASLIARLDRDDIRSVLAKQLNDELGNGDPKKAHRVLFRRMLADLEPHAPAGDRDALLAPGRRLAQRLADHYLKRPPMESVGGTLIMEVFGKQVDQAIGTLLRRQSELDVSKLTWLVLHEELEEDHADESVMLARMTPPEQEPEMCRGAEDLADLGFAYLDDIYGVVFG
jgi:DMATS type aromatic prenyltransferase